MANCITCGDELHPERAATYDYCTKRRCRERNARAPRVASIGVNKAADQFIVLDDRTEREIASGVQEAAGGIRIASEALAAAVGPCIAAGPRPGPPFLGRVGPLTMERSAGEPRAHVPSHGAEAGGDREEARREPISRRPDPGIGHEPGRALSGGNTGAHRELPLVDGFIGKGLGWTLCSWSAGSCSACCSS